MWGGLCRQRDSYGYHHLRARNWSQYTNKSGQRRAVSKAEPSQVFWQAWNADKGSVESEGISVSKDRQGHKFNQWAFC